MNQPLIQRIAQASQPLEPVPTSQPDLLQELAGIRCILFDIYGTLLISASGDIGTTVANARGQAMHEAFRAVFPDAGEASIPDPDALTVQIRAAHERVRAQGIDYPEVDIRQIWREVLEAAGHSSPDLDLCARLAVEYEVRMNPVWPMPELADTLLALRHKKIQLGIVSNAQFYTPYLFPALTGRTLSDWGFDSALCAWSWKCLEAKPSPSLFVRVLATLAERGIAAAQVVYVGNDMLNDIWPASRLGCRTALFAGDARSLRLRGEDPRVQEATPDIVISKLSQLLHCVSS